MLLLTLNIIDPKLGDLLLLGHNLHLQILHSLCHLLLELFVQHVYLSYTNG